MCVVFFDELRGPRCGVYGGQGVVRKGIEAGVDEASRVPAGSSGGEDQSMGGASRGVRDEYTL